MNQMKIDLFLRFSTKPGQKLKIIRERIQENNLLPQVPEDMVYHNHWYWKYNFEQQGKASESALPSTYAYQFVDEKGQVNEDWGVIRKNDLAYFQDGLTIVDSWIDMGLVENNFYTAPFLKVFEKSHKVAVAKPIEKGMVRFSVKSPMLNSNEIVCISGDSDRLGNWSLDNHLKMQFDGYNWYVDIAMDALPKTFEYKYCIFNNDSQQLRFEYGENRMFRYPKNNIETLLIQDVYVREEKKWRGSGIAVPVFSLRTHEGLGVGEFTDIKKLVDWAKLVSVKMIQLLPVNDTTSTHSKLDSYPYAAISPFALHPLYISIETVAGKKYAQQIKSHLQKKETLNSSVGVDYEAVMELKWDALATLYAVMKDDVFADESYTHFFNQNKNWLVPYAAYSYLRDKFGSPDASKWGSYQVYNNQSILELSKPNTPQFDRIAIHYFIQYQLHLQLKDAHDYANKNGIILKGDIAIGVHRHGADTWTEPALYHLDKQAGAPPDDFAVSGQNWGFPTYNWVKMKSDGFAWWKSRFEQMSNYFDAFRIDHILGFFRIWSIPDHAVEGIMGRFVPAIPVFKEEFEQREIWLHENRFCLPYINDFVIHEIGMGLDDVIKEFLDKKSDGHYAFKQSFSTQKLIETHFNNLPETKENSQLKQILFNLHTNVVLWKDEHAEGQYHFRFNAASTSSFKHLDEHVKHQLHEMYNDYFFNRQESIWRAEAIEKLPALKKCTDMLVCGEDLGMVPKSVPEIMSYLGFLCMEVQRMPKQANLNFFDPAHANYLSVVTPSTHDMSTLREWWLEDKKSSQVFYNNQLWQHGTAPDEANTHIVRSIILQHLASPAMWAVFQLQDMFAIHDNMRISNPYDERINIPGDPKHYWRYRMHLPIEELIKNDNFNKDLQYCIISSGR
jgi:4-alpha-glucanotransferase